jgi:type II protein arginine methyltransferase
VVTEIVDAGLLGEGILQSLVHAWDHLLLPAGSNGQVANVGRVVPDAADVWVVPIECIHIARKYQLLNPDMTQQDLSNMTQVIIWSLCFQMLLKLQQVLKTDFSKWKYRE